MSLKAFHIVFVVVVIATAVVVGAWGLRHYRANGDTLSLALGIGSLVLAIGMIPYGVWFLRKLKHVSFL